MASARNGATFWSRALITNATKDMIRASKVCMNIQQNTMKYQSAVLPTERRTKFTPLPTTRVIRSKIILKKALTSNNTLACRKHAASLIARKLVKKRTQVLKGLVPGGEYMDESRLIKETLDYIISLEAQVRVMQHLANAAEHFNTK
ncbi:hypothetical protein Ancab_017808 [Ancistrocladus abbreviatus]